MKNLYLLVIIVTILTFSFSTAQDQYITLDGTNDYIALPISYSGLNVVPVISVEAWVRTSFSSSSYNSNWAIVDFDRSDFYNVYIHGDGRVGFSTYAPTGSINDFFGNTIVNDGQWHHITTIYDGTDKHIYVDGVLDATISNPHGGSGLGKATTRFGFIGDGSEATSFNGNKNNIHYNGDISELRIWSRVLSPEEVDANKLPGTPDGTEAGLFAYYTFDNGLAGDLAVNNFDGTSFNDPIFNNTDGAGGSGTSTGDSNFWTQIGSNITFNSGDVGIGTSTIPSGYKLAVDGKIIAEEIKVKISGDWPDYVFTKNYKLPSLEEVEKHIKEKGHLINVPSALEVETNGLELGEMNRILLEKIEELTLYILEQEKRIELLEKTIR
jgi:hypothetical protein